MKLLRWLRLWPKPVAPRVYTFPAGTRLHFNGRIESTFILMTEKER